MADTDNKHEFRAEVRKVLSILTNSLYTNREIFLRELISNASDALDKLRFRTSRGEKPVRDDLPLEIRITLDEEKDLLTISDTGLGMTEQELAENLGTIAHSGTEAYLADLTKEHKEGEATDASNIIGRFGVGFYSVFMVADEVKVYSRPSFVREGEDASAHVWVSDGLGTYTIEKVDDTKPVRGTTIEVHLKEDAKDYLEKYRIDSVIHKHSAFVPFPIFVNGEQVNTQPALWREPKTSVTEEQYTEFYKSMTYDQKAPMDIQHIAVDVPVQFTALLFIPSTSADIMRIDRDEWGLDLYSRRVLIQHNNHDLLPEYLAFMRGVVDVEDLPLNISRETLQENLLISKIRQTLVKQTLTKLEKMAADDKKKYDEFWHLHSRIFKMAYSDYANRDRICGLMRFTSSALPDGEGEKPALTSFDEYIGRALEGQKTIWYLSAPNREAARISPYIARFRKKGIEVLYLLEPIDEFVMENLREYKEWKFKSIENADEDDLKDFADKETDTKDAVTPLSQEENDLFDQLVKHIKSVLGEKVKEVRVSSKIADSPAVLVAQGGMTNSMEKIMRYLQKDETMPIKDLEVNRDHPLMRSMLRMFKANPTDTVLEGMIQSLFDACTMLDGYMKDPQVMANRAADLLTKSAAWYTEVRKI